MSSESVQETGGQVSGADASGRPLSQNPDAVRKREARAGRSSRTSTTSGGRGGAEPSTKGNPMRPSEWSTLGEPLSPHEAERQLFYAHKGIAMAMRSQVDLDGMKEEFEVAGENYAFVANKMWPPLRVMIRFVAPVVLVAVLVGIWAAMIAATPWWTRLSSWWTRRGEEQEQPSGRGDVYDQVVTDQAPVDQAVRSNGHEPPSAQQAPPIPRRPTIVRRFSR